MRSIKATFVTTTMHCTASRGRDKQQHQPANMDEDKNRQREAETGVDSIFSSAVVDKDDDCSCRTDATTIPASNDRRITNTVCFDSNGTE